MRTRTRPLPAWLPYGIAATLLSVLILSLTGYTIWSEARRSKMDAAVSTENLALLLAGQVSTLFARADTLVVSAANYYNDAVRHGELDGKRLNGFLAAELAQLPEAQNLRILDSQGILRWGSDNLAGISFADRAYFTRARDNPQAGLVIDGPLVGRVTNKPLMFLSRRLNLPDGSFAGIAYVVIGMDRLDRLFSQVDLGKSGLVVLRGTDMALVTRYPRLAHAEAEENRRSVSQEFSDLARAQPVAGTYEATPPLDRVRRVFSYHRVEGYPFITVVGRATSDFMAGWQRNALLLALLSGSMLCATLFAARQLYRASRHVEVAEARWRFALDSGAQGVWDLDVASREGYWSPRVLEMFGVGPEELRGALDDLLARIHPQDRDSAVATLEAFLRGEAASYADEFRVRHQDGHTLWVASRGKVTARDSDGHPQRLIGTYEDITQRKQAEMDLRAARDLNVAANQLKSTFLANMSHEIRTPMNAVLGMTHLALQADPAPPQREYLEKIQRSGQHLMGVINDILDFSKIEANKLVLEEVPLDVPALVANMVSMLEVSTRQKGLQVRVHIDPLPQGLLGDAKRLGQALLNFAGNAVKFTERGQLSVSVTLLEDGPQTALLRIAVQDTGVGVAPEHLPLLFEPFVQADTTTTRVHGGTGLGLAITKRLVQAMGGTVGASSVVGQGSTFWFTARLRKADVARPSAPQALADDAQTAAAAAADEDAAAALRQQYPGRRVLLVDDDEFNREIGSILLQNVGLVTVLAVDGQEAVEMALATAFDLILMDMQMPRLDGLEATRRIRASAQGSGVPIVAMTANAFPEDKRKCLAAGMNDFLSKPVEPEVLYAVVLRQFRLAAQAAKAQPA